MADLRQERARALLTTCAFIITMSARYTAKSSTLTFFHRTMSNSDMRYLGRVLISHLSCTLDIKTVNYSAVEVNEIIPNTLKE